MEKIFFPQLSSSQYRYYQLLNRRVQPRCDWLEMGCGHQMFAPWMPNEEARLIERSGHVVGIDLDWEGMKKNTGVHGKIFGNLEQLPLRTSQFDLVTANMVVEHLGSPSKVLAEVYRVLRPGGLFIFHTPNRRCLTVRLTKWLPQWIKNLMVLWLEGRSEEDVFPTRYRLNSLEDITRLGAAAGLPVDEIQMVSTSAVSVMLGPVSIVELLYLRFIERDSLKWLRSNLLVVLRKAA